MGAGSWVVRATTGALKKLLVPVKIEFILALLASPSKRIFRGLAELVATVYHS